MVVLQRGVGDGATRGVGLHLATTAKAGQRISDESFKPRAES
jgi:hypothetical protein